MAINNVTISGNLTRDPEHKHVGASSEVLEFTVAVNERRKQGEQWVDDPQFIDCELWGPRAHTLGQYLRKGMKVCVSGSLRYHTWEAKDGGKRSRISVNVRDIELPARVDASRTLQDAPRQPVDAPAYNYRTPF